MNQQLLPLNAVRARVPYSKVHIYRLIRANSFPKPVRVGANRVAWIESEIEEWINKRIKERDHG
jgi:prophage regulatory protein